jgi:RNA polymerase sigma-70 factor, ECF subfamily
MSLTEEKQLVEQAKTDPRAFGRLYDRYLDRIYSYAYRQTGNVMVAQDITAVTFEKALRHIRRHRWQEVSFGAWLYTIARNEIAQHYRRQKRLLDWQLPDPHSNGRLPETAVQQQERQQQVYQKVHQALAQLNDPDRDILGLRFFEGLDNQEIAQILNCSTDNVYVRIHRALKRLRGQMELLSATEEVLPHE